MNDVVMFYEFMKNEFTSIRRFFCLVVFAKKSEGANVYIYGYLDFPI